MNSEKKKPYAEVARERMEKTLENKRLEEAEQLAQAKAAFACEYEKEKTKLENGGMQQLFEEEWMPLIDGAAGRGERETVLVLQRNQGKSSSLWAQNRARYDVGVVFLKQEGFCTEFKERFSEGTGGDDSYPAETSVGIEVRW